ncbi:sister chromatid cohesion protein Dcc1 [Gaertneriomyces semiglobifer]|nr:sister chromatid cohesion protein Dcc1 [Gaertneriomyces semiglobifer]
MTGMSLDVKFSESSNEDAGRYMLMELPKAIADQIASELSDGCDTPLSLTIRGNDNDEAVICTPNQTYTVRSVQSSNALLIAAPSEAMSRTYEVQTALSCYHELSLTRPRLDRLRSLLSQSYYTGPVDESRNVGKRQEGIQTLEMLDFDALKSRIQASDAELTAGLEELGAVCLDGFWRLLSPEYQESTLKFILVSAAAEDIPLERMSLSGCLDMIDEEDIPPSIVKHILQFYAERTETSETDTIYTLSQYKIARFFGKQLLASAEATRFSVKTFMERWRAQVPETLTISLDMLQGLCLIDPEPTGQSIRYFPKSVLPMDAKPRFEMLFQVRRKWLRQDILPYIDDLASDPKKLDAILLKYGRMSKVTDQTFYTSRLIGSQ